MTIALVTILLLVSIAVLVYPFFTQPVAQSATDASEELAAQLRRARDRVYEEIRALQQEYFLNNLTEDEYRSQLADARAQAAALIKRQQQVQETVAVVEQAIEEHIQATEKGAPAGQAVAERQP